MFDIASPTKLLFKAVVILIGLPLAYFFYRGYQVRRMFQQWQKRGVVCLFYDMFAIKLLTPGWLGHHLVSGFVHM